MFEDNLAYYERRAREEEALASAANGPEAASAHRLLAIEYASEARKLGTHALSDRDIDREESPRQPHIAMS